MDKRDLYEKYRITKMDGSPVDPKAVYFVLRLDSDPAARQAAIKYAVLTIDDNPTLAKQLVRVVDALGGG